MTAQGRKAAPSWDGGAGGSSLPDRDPGAVSGQRRLLETQSKSAHSTVVTNEIRGKGSAMNGWRQRIVLIAFALCLAVTVIFAMRAFHRRPHPKVDEPIRPWMSVPYVAHSYHVPPHVLFEAIKVPSEHPPDRRPIGRIAREQNRPVQEVIADLQNAIVSARPRSMPPGSPKKDVPPRKP